MYAVSALLSAGGQLSRPREANYVPFQKSRYKIKYGFEGLISNAYPGLF